MTDRSAEWEVFEAAMRKILAYDPHDKLPDGLDKPQRGGNPDRVGANPKAGYCCALVRLGPRWSHSKRPVFCTNKAKPGSLFCGIHESLGTTIRREHGQ